MTTQVRVCLVGAGRVAKVHANSLVNRVPGGKLVAIVDVAEEALDATADQFEVERRFRILEDALEWGEFEAVVITTPTFTHDSKCFAFINIERDSIYGVDSTFYGIKTDFQIPRVK